MKIYLATRYRRIDEMKRRAEDLRNLGHLVTSRWVDGHHEAPGALDDPSWPGIAQEDVDDVRAADVVVSFTQKRGGGGGRHVEFGLGLGLGKRLVLVGPREHLFHTLPSVEVYLTWSEALESLATQP